MNYLQQACEFCNEFSGGNENSFSVRYGNIQASRVVLSTPNFRIVPSLGQLVEGYLLIVPVQHFTALADIPDSFVAELIELCSVVRNALSQLYGTPFFFEHGIRTKGSGGCGIDHAHLHAVPTTGITYEPIRQIQKAHPLRNISGVRDLKMSASSGSYIYYGEADGQHWVAPSTFMPSQYIRQLISQSLGNDAWDWRQYGIEQRLIDSVRVLSEWARVDIHLKDVVIQRS
ncbi:MAG TPA: HIT domain-containing protein [Pyrinomonadaceae bacterium]|nr:HIT domain-containing protein [Pyrinomonadaceae bacterium]